MEQVEKVEMAIKDGSLALALDKIHGWDSALLGKKLDVHLPFFALHIIFKVYSTQSI